MLSSAHLSQKISLEVQIIKLVIMQGDWNRSVGIATRWTFRGSNPRGEGDFLFPTAVHKGSGAHSDSITMHTAALSRG